jgi:predicted AAA+ superfamily ATPase
LDNGLILTEAEEFEEMIQGKKIIVRPIWKWLLEENNEIR